MQMISKMDKSPVATNTSDANEQHYEVPADSINWYLVIISNTAVLVENEKDLNDAEVKSLLTTCERVGLQDGQQVLDMVVVGVH